MNGPKEITGWRKGERERPIEARMALAATDRGAFAAIPQA